VALLQSEEGINTPFDIHFDMAPSVYIIGNPGRTDATTRTFERASGKLTAMNPITGKIDQLTKLMADPVELRTLHMITADQYRTPTFVLFGNPNYYFQTFGPPVMEETGFAWNHGGVAPEINTTWLGMVGPGVNPDGLDSKLWSDHTDIRPTILLLAGLQDDYSHQGRALVEHLSNNVLPPNLLQEKADFDLLAKAYKQINAPLGQFGVDSLKVSDKALRSNDPSDTTYNVLEDDISGLTDARNALAGTIEQILEGSEFQGQHIDHNEAQELNNEAQNLLQQMHILTQ
jgi:hypothetical protein